MGAAVCVQGFGALYAGVLPALISVAPSGAVFYGTYDLLKVPTGLCLRLLACECTKICSVVEYKAFSLRHHRPQRSRTMGKPCQFLGLQSDGGMPILCCRSGTWRW